jgi:ABC-type transport system involved in Fe-S cluster assembly fused permease/ATPase subunit
MYHIHRSSGALLAKIERGARGYEELLDQITFELTPLLVGLIIMIIALYRYSPLLALFEALLFASILLFSYLFARYGSQRWEKVFIKSYLKP